MSRRAGCTDTGLGHRQVQRWNLPKGWVISKQPAHTALISEAGFIAAQDIATPRGPAGPAARRICWLGCWRAGGAGASWSQPGPTTSPPDPGPRSFAGQVSTTPLPFTAPASMSRWACTIWSRR